MIAFVTGPTDASKMADALKGNTHLKELYASGHSIGAEGAASFGEALKQNSTLQVCHF